MSDELHALRALLREWAYHIEIDTYDSSLCWACGKPKWGKNDTPESGPSYPNCQPDCLIRRSRELVPR